jgi:hypothetical protein
MDLLLVDLASREIVERFLRHADDVVPDEGRAFGRAVLWVL